MSVDGNAIVVEDANNGVVANVELQALREKVALLEQIRTLQGQVGLSPMQQQASPHQNAAVPKNVRVPEGRYTMSLTEYRTYSRDCTDYKSLMTGYTDRQIVLQLRLNMDNDLKQAIDTNYPEWNSFTVEEAIKTVGDIVNQMSNCAVYRKEFTEMKQGENERLREFATRLRSCATDCSFVCPYDDSHDLTNYHLIDRLRSGVFDVRLQQELLQKQATLNTVQGIVQYCEDYESAVHDRTVLKSSSSTDHMSHDEMVAALSLYRRTKKGLNKLEGEKKDTEDICECCGTHKREECGNCGEVHADGECRAKGKSCFNCGKPNHLAKVCRSQPVERDVGCNAVIL